MQKLFISLPGESQYSVYGPGTPGGEVFVFTSFDGERQVKISLAPAADENLEPCYRNEDETSQVLDRPAYLQLVSTTVEHIRKNGLGKIVVSRKERFTKKTEPVALFKKLVKAYPSACVYLFTHPKVGTWMGATPETLLKSDGKTLKTMSLAGTRKKGEEGTFTAKEQAEQQLVTDYIFSLFKKQNGLAQVSQQQPQLQEAGNVVHFKSEIQAKLETGFDVWPFAKKLHPTPAVAGFPKKGALEFINSHEGYDREFYAGYFGLGGGGNVQLFVNLRCMQVFQDSVVLYAGGGITQDSDPEQEWEETEAKMRTLLNVMEMG